MYGPQVPAEIWSKPLADGGEAVGIFNRSDKAVRAVVTWRNLGYLKPPRQVRDLWTRQDFPPGDTSEVELPPHGCALWKVVGK